jgi:hypothetical protein
MVEKKRAGTIFVLKGREDVQSGWYGPQPGDNPATILREVQQCQIAQASMDFLAGLK